MCTALWVALQSTVYLSWQMVVDQLCKAARHLNDRHCEILITLERTRENVNGSVACCFCRCLLLFLLLFVLLLLLCVLLLLDLLSVGAPSAGPPRLDRPPLDGPSTGPPKISLFFFFPSPRSQQTAAKAAARVVQCRAVGAPKAGRPNPEKVRVRRGGAP